MRMDSVFVPPALPLTLGPVRLLWREIGFIVCCCLIVSATPTLAQTPAAFSASLSGPTFLVFHFEHHYTNSCNMDVEDYGFDQAFPVPWTSDLRLPLVQNNGAWIPASSSRTGRPSDFGFGGASTYVTTLSPGGALTTTEAGFWDEGDFTVDISSNETINLAGGAYQFTRVETLHFRDGCRFETVTTGGSTTFVVTLTPCPECIPTVAPLDLTVTDIRPVQKVFDAPLVQGLDTAFEIKIHATECRNIPSVPVLLTVDGRSEPITIAPFEFSATSGPCDVIKLVNGSPHFVPKSLSGFAVSVEVDPVISSPGGTIPESNEANNRLDQNFSVVAPRKLQLSYVPVLGPDSDPNGCPLESNEGCLRRPINIAGDISNSNAFTKRIFPVSSGTFAGDLVPWSISAPSDPAENFFGSGLSLTFLRRLYLLGKVLNHSADHVVGIVPVGFFEYYDRSRGKNWIGVTTMAVGQKTTNVFLVQERTEQTVAHELGHALGLGHDDPALPLAPVQTAAGAARIVYDAENGLDVSDKICFMAPSGGVAAPFWIDPHHYFDLLNVQGPQDPELFLLTGQVHRDGGFDLGPSRHLADGTSSSSGPGDYVVRTYDVRGQLLNALTVAVSFQTIGDVSSGDPEVIEQENALLTAAVPFSGPTASIELSGPNGVISRFLAGPKLLDDAIDDIQTTAFIGDSVTVRAQLHRTVDDFRLKLGAGDEAGAAAALNTLSSDFAQFVQQEVLTDPLQFTLDQLRDLVTVVESKMPPVLRVPDDVIAEAANTLGTVVAFSASATDSVEGNLSPVCLPASGSMFPFGTTIVTCSATNGRGVTSTASFTVTVRDTTPPTLMLPTRVIAEATSTRGSLVSFAATAIDAVDGSLPIACAPTSGSQFALGTTGVACSARDSHGNQATGSFAIDVRDTIAPQLMPPANLTVSGSSGGAAVTYSLPTVVEQGSGLSTLSCLPGSGTMFPIGTTVVTCRATDVAGNTGSATFSVTVTPPVPAAVDGEMFGVGHLITRKTHQHFKFLAARRSNHEIGRLEFWESKTDLCRDDDAAEGRRVDEGGPFGQDHKGSASAFEMTSTTSIVFSDDPRFTPAGAHHREMSPRVDTLVMSGTGRWNGRAGFRFEMRATDQGEPGSGRDTFSLIVSDAHGTVVVSVGGTLDGGNIQAIPIVNRGDVHSR